MIEENEKNSLSRFDWVQIAVHKLEAFGVDKVKVDPLAKELGVSRGSFYWHFTKRQDLLDAVLSHWQEVTTADVIEQLEQLTAPASVRLENLMKFGFSMHPNSLSLEKAIRAWSLSDDGVANLVLSVDTQRISYLNKLLRAVGHSPELAKQYARLVYYCRMGMYTQVQVPPLNERLKTMQTLLNVVSKPNK